MTENADSTGQASTQQMLPSFVRTAVPLAVAQIVAYFASRGLDLGPYQTLLEQGLGWLAGLLYYMAVRVIEVKIKPKYGWLLGAPKAPTYDAVSKLDPASPTSESAGPAADAEDGTPTVTLTTDGAPAHEADGEGEGSTRVFPS